MLAPRILELTPRVWCVRRPLYLSCSYFALTDDGVVLVDAGMDVQGRDMLAGLERAGLGPRDVVAILLTHWHNDHSAGAEALRRLSGADVFYSTREAAHFTRETRRTLRHRLSDSVPELGLLATLKGILGEAPTRPVRATRHVREGDVLAGGFRVLETPGHSPGHLSFWLPAEGALFSGDAVAVCGGGVRYMSRCLTGDVEQARASMRRCLELPAELLCPGHRAPLVEGLAAERRRALEELAAGRPWPVLS